MSLNIGIISSSYKASAPSGNLLLDDYPGAAAAYSLRKLRTAYTGAAVRVLRTGSSSTSIDIGFKPNGDFDNVALAAFTGVNTANVTIWYDQSGNGNNAINVNGAFPTKIYISGSPVLSNGKPSIIKDNIISTLQASSASGAGNGIRYISSYIAYSVSSLDAANYLAYEVPTGNGILAGGTFSTVTGFGQVVNGVLVQSTNETISPNLKLGGTKNNTVPNVFFNGALAATGVTGAITSFMTLLNGTGSSNQNFYGNVSEMIFYNSDQSANNAGINNNINSFYSIY